MALSPDIVPVNINLAPIYSDTYGSLNDILISIAPKKADGTAYDFTDATAVHLVASSQPQNFLNLSQDETLTLVSHDATGLKAKLTASNQAGFISNLQGTTFRCVLMVTDGTVQVLAASGSVNFNQTP